MKRIILFLMLSVWAGAAIAQTPAANGNLKVTLTVKDPQLKGMPNVTVDFIEMETKQKISVKTNPAGIAEATLDKGKVWQMAIDKIRDYWYWQIPIPKIPVGKTAELTKTITYNYEQFLRETRPTVNREKLAIVTEKQQNPITAKPEGNMGIITLTVNKADKSPLANTSVGLTCFKLLKTFTATTNAGGVAVFNVPIGNEYQIDIDGINDFSYIDLLDKPGMSYKKNFTYEPTNVQETNVNDTIRQQLPDKAEGTSARVLVSLKAMQSAGVPWVNENVFLAEIKGTKVYTQKTDSNGEVKFLLPKGKKYMLHFNYQQDVDAFDLTRNRGIGHSNKTVTYRPEPRYQYPDRYIPSPDALFLTDFKYFIDKQYPKPSDGSAILTYAKWGGKVNAQSQDAVLHLAFTGGATGENSKPINVAFVIDKSGSMMGADRIDNVKIALMEFVQKLRPHDVVSVVVFDDGKMTLIPAQAIGSDKNAIISSISMLDAGGGTDIYVGLVEGYEQALKNFKKNGTNRVVLLTDGHGITPVETILAKSKEYNAKGIECSVVGVGQDYNVGLLTHLASQGGGFIELIDKADVLNGIFTRELAGLLMPSAEKVKIEVEYNKHLLFAQLHGFPVDEKRDGKFTLKLRNAYDGLSQLAMVKFTLVNPSQAIENEPVIIRTKYYDPGKKTDVVTETKTYLNWSPASGDLEMFDDKHDKKLYAIAIMNQTLKVMSEAFAKGDRDLAKKTLAETAASVKKLFPQSEDADVDRLIESIKGYLDILNNLKE